MGSGKLGLTIGAFPLSLFQPLARELPVHVYSVMGNAEEAPHLLWRPALLPRLEALPLAGRARVLIVGFHEDQPPDGAEPLPGMES